MHDSFWIDLKPLLPHLTLAVSTLCLLLIGVWRGAKGARFVSKAAQWGVLPLVILLAILVRPGSETLSLFEGLVVVNTFTRFVDFLILGTTGLMIYLHGRYMKVEKGELFEYPLLLLFSALGMMVMVAADNFLSLYIGLELQSLSLYVLVALRREEGSAAEAGLKYFVLGSLSSCFILFGSSYLYGFLGSTGFEAVSIGVKAETTIPLMVYGAMALILAGIAFKISAAPFHMWAPDVYEGSSLLVTAVLASAPKIAALALLIRLLVGPFAPFMNSWQVILAFLAVFSVVLGAYGALFQNTIKRLLAYSSISHMGYALIGLVPGLMTSIESILNYLFIYLMTIVTTFICLLSLRKRDQGVVHLQDLGGLGHRNPFLGFCLGTMMFSLAGIPPTAGFFAKFSVFRSAIMGEYMSVALIGILASVVGAVYYLKIIKIMYFDRDEASAASSLFDKEIPRGSKFLIGMGTAMVLFYILYPQIFMQPIEEASRSLLATH